MDRPDLGKGKAQDVETSAASASSNPTDWVDDLIQMTRPGMDMVLPERGSIERPPPFVFDDFS